MDLSPSITLSDFELSRFFFVLILLLSFSHFFGYLFHRFSLPRVIGEIFGGLLLGPSFLGHFFHDVYSWLFEAFPSEGKLISMVYWLGLILLMFVSGFELQKDFEPRDRKNIIVVLLGATIIPFIAGWMAPSFFDFTPYIGFKQNKLAFQIIIGVAVAVTSIPVISKIFIDLNIIHTRFAKIVLAIATIHDIFLWALVAVATGLVSERGGAESIARTFLTTALFFGLSLAVIPKVFQFTYGMRFNLVKKSSRLGYILSTCFLFSALASVLKVNIVFGAFVAGIVIGLMPDNKLQAERQTVKEMSLSFFTPMYFAIVGLKIDLIYHFDFLFFIGFLLFSTFFEILGTIFSARLCRNNWLSSFNLGVAMSTRGGPGIVLATLAFDLGIINQTFFVTLVLVAIFTSLLAGLWFRFVLSKGWSLLE